MSVDLKAIAGKGREFVTVGGARYLIPRRSLAVRVECVDFVEKVQELQGGAQLGDTQAVRALVTALVDLLEPWLQRADPSITRAQILEDFDVEDIPGLMAVINGFEAEAAEAQGPLAVKARAQRKGKSTGSRSAAR